MSLPPPSVPPAPACDDDPTWSSSGDPSFCSRLPRAAGCHASLGWNELHWSCQQQVTRAARQFSRSPAARPCLAAFPLVIARFCPILKLQEAVLQGLVAVAIHCHQNAALICGGASAGVEDFFLLPAASAERSALRPAIKHHTQQGTLARGAVPPAETR